MNQEMTPEKERPTAGWLNHFSLLLTGKTRLIKRLYSFILVAVRILALLMTLVIFWGVVDIVRILYAHVTTPPYGMLTMNEILGVFGAFLAVLIAIEIFVNIVLYLREEVIHVRLVLATALMAAARKVIVFDFAKLDVAFVWATAAVILALAVSYWLIHHSICSQRREDESHALEGARRLKINPSSQD
jgi:uncharacterized membrane protein (DUF373 family)